jgi:2,5-diketo-D-gluconate reductase B
MTLIPKQDLSGIPLLGLGTWKLYGEECERTVRSALDLGYRHIDTADAYKNHAAVGRALSDFPREELFVTSKLFVEELLPKQVMAAAPRFLKELGTPYLDLLLIHWPNPEVRLEETLEAMVRCQEKGYIRHIGVSNFVRSHLEALAPFHFPILTNQIEMHPYLQRRLLVPVCKKLSITVTAYRPLAKGAFEKDPLLQKIGGNHEKTPSQIALRWLVQQGIVAIPKASSLEHLKQNCAIFDFTLSAQEMQEIDGLERGLRFCAPEGLPVCED